MKRISLSTVCSQSQTPLIPSTQKQTQQNKTITSNKQQETPTDKERQISYHINCNLLPFDNLLLENCLNFNQINESQNNIKQAFHQLRHKSLKQNQKQLIKHPTEPQPNQKSLHKTKQCIHLQNTNNSKSINFHNPSTFSLREQHRNQDEFPLSLEKNKFDRKANALQTLSRLSETDLYEKRLQSSLSPIIFQSFRSKKRQHQRMSTLDSYRIKSYLQETVGSISPDHGSVFMYQKQKSAHNRNLTSSDPLQMMSKLCQSVKIQTKIGNKSEIPYKSHKIIQHKSFIRSFKHSNNISQQKYNHQIPKTIQNQNLNSNQNLKASKSQNIVLSEDNQHRNKTNTQVFISSLQINQKDPQIKISQLQNNLFNMNRIKTLAQCGNTIVSRYNKSSQKRSILQQSSILFQGSKYVDDFQFQQRNKGDKENNIQSDGQIEMRKQNKHKTRSLQNHHNLSQQLNQIQSINLQTLQSIVNNKNKKTIMNNKMNKRGFLRSQIKSVPIKAYNCDENIEQVRFDLNTYLQYGPL